METDTQRLIISVILIIECLWVAVEIYRLQNKLGASYFRGFVFNLFVFFGAFVVARMLAVVVDRWLDLSVSWFGASTLMIFFAIIGWGFHRQVYVVSQSKILPTGQRKLAVIVNDGFMELREIRDNLRVAIHNSDDIA